jgi:dihydroorotase
MLTRREFSRHFLAGGAALLASDASAAVQQANVTVPSSHKDCDLLIKGGVVIDPGQQLHELMDVAVKDGKILEVSKNFPENRAAKVVSAKDRIVTPGLIDVHVHCFDGFGGINADRYCLGRGVTTVVDAGSTGYLGIGAFVQYVVKPSITRIHPLVNIAALGLLTGGAAKKTSHDASEAFMNGMDNPDWIYPQLTAKAAEINKPAVVGIKVRLEDNVQGPRDLECLKMGLQAAEASRLPVMAHIDDPYSPLPDILKMMRKGDIFTHIYNNHSHGILDANGKVLPEVREARDRGVYLDPAQGRTHFSFDVAEKALQQGFLPDTISTDLNTGNSRKGVFDLPTMVSKFMALGMELYKSIELVTVNPARMFDYGVKIGTLRPGFEAEISIFELQDGKFEFEDSDGTKRSGNKMLLNRGVICRGQLYTSEILQEEERRKKQTSAL